MRPAALAVILAACSSKSSGDREGRPSLQSALRDSEVELAAGLSIEEHHATLAMDPAGAMVAAWRSEGIDGDIWVRYFDPSFAPDPAQQVGSGDEGWTDYPDVVGDETGFRLTYADGNNLALRDSETGRRFEAGVQVFKRETESFYPHFPDLASAPDPQGGVNTVVTWLASDSVVSTTGFYQVRWLDENLDPVYDKGWPVTLSGTGENSNPADVVGLPDGRFATVYARDGAIWLQLMALGELDGDRLDVSGEGAGSNPSRPMIAVSPSGQLAVSWHDRDDATRDLFGATVRLYESDGSPLTPRIALGTDNAVASRPVAEFLGDDWLLVAWSEYVSPDDEDIFAQLWAADGSWSSPPERINTVTAGRQKRTALAVEEVLPGEWTIGFAWETVPPGEALSVRATRWILEVP